jgi:hypothetical protein
LILKKSSRFRTLWTASSAFSLDDGSQGGCGGVNMVADMALKHPGRHTRAAVPDPAATRQPNEIAGSSLVVSSGSATTGRAQLIQKLFRCDQIGGAETLRKAVVDRLEACDGIGRLTLTSQQGGEAGSRAQLPG